MSLFDIAGIGAIADLGRDILAMFPNAEQRNAAASKLQDLVSQVAAAQSATNTAEAGSDNLFVAGWRPFVGWACGIGFVYGVIVQPMLAGALTVVGWPPVPPVDVSALVAILTGMLGLGGLRTYEKIQNGTPSILSKITGKK